MEKEIFPDVIENRFHSGLVIKHSYHCYLQLIERIVNMLNVDKSERTIGKKAIPDTDAQKKLIANVQDDINKLCKDVSILCASL